jgi:hypothetical protein
LRPPPDTFYDLRVRPVPLRDTNDQLFPNFDPENARNLTSLRARGLRRLSERAQARGR